MKFVDFIIGIAVLLMGVIPLLGNITYLSSIASLLGTPGSAVYQGILIVVGILVLLYSFNGRKQVR